MFTAFKNRVHLSPVQKTKHDTTERKDRKLKTEPLQRQSNDCSLRRSVKALKLCYNANMLNKRKALH